jgi:hypothetical protein
MEGSDSGGTLSLAAGGGGGGGGGACSSPSHSGAEASKAARLQRMAAAVRELIECIGEDASREGLLQTPARSAKALLTLTEGYAKVRCWV